MENFNNLSIKELRKMRNAAGLPAAKHETKEAIVRQLTVTAFPEAILKEFSNKPEIRKPIVREVAPKLTPEQVTEGLEAYIKRGLKIRFDADSWMIKNGAAEDSGSLSMSINAIRQKADIIMRARFPAAIVGEFDELASPKGRIPVLSF